jgi:hypothetical protein
LTFYLVSMSLSTGCHYYENSRPTTSVESIHVMVIPTAEMAAGGKTLLTTTECDVVDGTCDDLKREFKWVPFMTNEQALRYKFIVDV